MTLEKLLRRVATRLRALADARRQTPLPPPAAAAANPVLPLGETPAVDVDYGASIAVLCAAAKAQAVRDMTRLPLATPRRGAFRPKSIVIDAVPVLLSGASSELSQAVVFAVRTLRSAGVGLTLVAHPLERTLPADLVESLVTPSGRSSCSPSPWHSSAESSPRPKAAPRPTNRIPSRSRAKSYFSRGPR